MKLHTRQKHDHPCTFKAAIININLKKKGINSTVVTYKRFILMIMFINLLAELHGRSIIDLQRHFMLCADSEVGRSGLTWAWPCWYHTELLVQTLDKRDIQVQIKTYTHRQVIWEVLAYLVAGLWLPGHQDITVQLIVDSQKRLIHFQICALGMTEVSWGKRKRADQLRPTNKPNQSVQMMLQPVVSQPFSVKLLRSNSNPQKPIKLLDVTPLYY